jgi:RNA polymerase sigma-70 factor (ECF subfamily)
MKKVREGQLNFAGLLFERYKKILFSFFYNQTRDKNLSEDLVQITFYKMIKYKHNFRDDSHFKAWIFTIARNAMKDEFKKRKVKMEDIGNHEHKFIEGTQADTNIVQYERSEFLKRALKHLSPEKRELLILIKLNGKKYREVAEILNLKESVVKSKVFRAIRELQNHYCQVKESF